jgi:hypothetical protein
MPLKKLQELCRLVKLGADKKLKDIPLPQFTKEETRKKVDPTNLNVQIPPKNDQPIPKKGGFGGGGGGGAIPETGNFDKDAKSEMKISLCEASLLPVFSANYDFILGINHSRDSFYSETNKLPVLHYTYQSGAARNALISESINNIRALLEHENFKSAIVPDIQQILGSFSKSESIDKLTDYDKSLFAGVAAIIGGWSDALKPGHNVEVDDVSLKNVCMLSGGVTLGKKVANIVNLKDPSLTVQQVPVAKVHPKERVSLPAELGVDLQSIIQCFKNFHSQYSAANSSTKNKIEL